jgi:Ca2+-binding RTX toxin-like protein
MSRISLRHLFSRLARRPASFRTTLHLESLEERRNPATASFSFNAASFTTGILTVTGTGPGFNDRLVLLRNGNGLSVFNGGVAIPIVNANGLGTTLKTMDYSLLQGSGGGIVVNGNNVNVSGTGGNDLIDLNSGAKGFTPIDVPTTLSGGSGQDSIAGGEGADSIDGGSGNDSIFGNGGNDTIAGSDGADRINGGEGNDSILGGAQADILHGGNGNDTITGDSGADTIFGDFGDDSLMGGTENDRIAGGTGLGGADGSDTILGESGNDALFGERGADSVDGGTGDDFLNGGGDFDTLLGGTGNDTLLGADGDDSLLGGTGVDSLNGGVGNDTLAGNDTATISDGSVDILNSGGAGQKTFFASATDPDIVLGHTQSSVTATLDAGNVLHINGTDSTDDRITIRQSGGFISVTGNKAGLAQQIVLIHRTDGSAVDFLPVGLAGVIANGGAGNDAITMTSTATFGATLQGGAGNDTLSGGNGADTLEGGTGNDRLAGNGGADLVFGASMAAPNSSPTDRDVIFGGDGNDTLVGSAGNDTINGGNGNDSLLGNDGNDSLFGSNGNDILSGGNGTDTANGGLGTDTGLADPTNEVKISLEL